MQNRIKKIIDKLSSKELHNIDSIKFSILSMFSSIPNFINSDPVCIEDLKFMIKGCNTFLLEIGENDNLEKLINKFKENWEEILNANLIIINNYSYLPDIIIPLQALISEENKNLFSIIALDENGFNIDNQDTIFEKFSIKTKIENFTYIDKITRAENKLIGNNLYLPIEESFSKEELRYEIKNVNKVKLSDDVMETLKMISNYIEEFNLNKDEYESKIIMNKERWKEVIKILKASAFLNGRKEVNLSDLFILKKILWSNKSQIIELGKMIYTSISYTINKNCSNLKIYSAEMIKLLVDMSRAFKIMKNEKNYYISNFDIVEWNSSFDNIRNKIIETKYYSKDFFDEKNNLFNIFIDEQDSTDFLNLFKIDDKLIFDWYEKLRVIIDYVNKVYYEWI